MAWTPVRDSNNVDSTIWAYEDTATASDTYSDANGTTAAGIRTFTFANGNIQKTYVRCRTIIDNVERGELC